MIRIEASETAPAPFFLGVRLWLGLYYFSRVSLRSDGLLV